MEELIFHPLDKDNPGEYISGCDFIGWLQNTGLWLRRSYGKGLTMEKIISGYISMSNHGDYNVYINGRKITDIL